MKCDTPYFAQNKKGESVPVRCGRCPPCKQHRVSSWVFRLLQEDAIATSAHFVTLTYDTTCVPISKNGFMDLRKKDVQLFLKRLRKNLDGQNVSTIKYYACGEYGTKNHRPHYHLIVFNCPQSEFFHDAWGLGAVHVGKVSSDSIAYTMKYIDKSNFKKRHARDDREKEFSLMSKGLGQNYLTDDVKSFHRSNPLQLYVTESGGRKTAMPRYYRKKLFTDQEQAVQADYVQKQADIQDELLLRRYNQMYSDKSEDVMTFSNWKMLQAEGRRISFNSRLKSRDI